MTRPTDEIEVAKLQERLAVTDNAMASFGNWFREHMITLMTDAIKEIFDKIPPQEPND